METLENIIAENILKHRKLAKLTQAELGEKLNFSDKSVSKWEKGESLPDIVTLKKMCDIFPHLPISLSATDYPVSHRLRTLRIHI